VGRFSPIAEQAISDLKPALEDVPPGSTIRILNSDPYLVAALYSEKGINTFFPRVESVIFEWVVPSQKPDQEPVYESKENEIAFTYLDGRLKVLSP
jgi:hypothetical protein